MPVVRRFRRFRRVHRLHRVHRVRSARVLAFAIAVPVVPLVPLATAGCGAHRGAAASPVQRLAAAVLSEQELPDRFLPAENAAMFRGLRPADPDCRALLALAAAPAPAFGGAPRVDVSFYQVDPGGWVAEHVLLAAPLPAHAFLAALRRAATGCDHVESRAGAPTMSAIRLRRAPLPVRGLGEESYTVRYSGWAGARHRFHLDIVAARIAGRLLVLAAETLVSPRKARDVAIRIAERAAGKLGGPASIG